MNLGEILVANGTSLFLLIILIICRHMTSQTRRPVDKIFSAIILIGVMGTILEPFTFLIDGKGGGFFWFVSILSNTVEYASTATVAVLWVWYVDLNLNHDVKRLKTKFAPMLIIWAILMLLLLGNIFGGFVFSIDENNVYSRQPLGYAFYIFLLISYLTSIYLYCKFRALHGRTQFFPIWMFLTPLFLSILVQVPFYGISVTFLGCSVGLIGIYLNLLSKQSLVDSLTGLYNRAYIEREIIVARRSKKYIYSGIMLDIDQFKQINDSFGHSEGDAALARAAKILINATDRDAIAFRFAGDEFIVLVKVPISKADTLESKTLAIEERIRTEAKNFNDSGKAPYKIVFSMGHAIYDTNFPDDVFFHNMDTEMYKDKQRNNAIKQ